MTYGAVPHAPLRGTVDRCTGSEKAAAGSHVIAQPSGASQSSGQCDCDYCSGHLTGTLGRCIGPLGADRPSGEPSFVLNLPLPPSVNRFAARLGNSSPVVLRWIRQCDRYVMALRPRPQFKGEFEAQVTWNIDYFGKGDIDNCLKPLLDYLQRVTIIENDRLCRRLVVDWGPLELGCRVAVRPWVAL
jgi:Holliday junction resolvase RusA-like endonuclease